MLFPHCALAVAAIATALITPCRAHAQQPASLAIVGARVWTADPERPWAEAIAVVGSRVVAVGAREDVQKRIGEDTRVVDASGGLVTPGWFDSHIHLFQGGLNLSSVQLRDAGSREAFVERLRAFAATRRPGEWITGGNWDHTLWGGQLPTRDWIDDATPNNPVWIRRLDGHMALANSLALQAAGVDAATPTPEGGSIERDEDGRPTGILRDNAMDLVDRVRPTVPTSRLLEALDVASDYLLRSGVTSVCHMGSMEHLRVLRTARDSGRLRVRVHASSPLDQWRLLEREIERHGRGDQWLTIGGLKGYVDGSLGSHTAAMLEPYADKPGDTGLLINPPQDLEHSTQAADAAGLHVMVHAIGDRANRIMLDIYQRVAQRNGPRDRRFRIEHAQHIHPRDMERFARLGVIASMQPYHIIDDGRWAEQRVGAERLKTSYAYRSLLDSGAGLALGSDWPVSPATPLEGIQAAVTRRTLDGQNPNGWVPSQKVTVTEALRAYTSDAAYAVFAENDKGVLAPGKLADMVLVDRDLFAVDPTTIADAEVRMTIVNGRVAYERD